MAIRRLFSPVDVRPAIASGDWAKAPTVPLTEHPFKQLLYRQVPQRPGPVHDRPFTATLHYFHLGTF